MTDLPNLTLILGGARSGKSALAEGLVQASGRPMVYLATAEPLDDEMSDRIQIHKDRRVGWTTVEEPLDVAAALDRIPAGSAILLDCLTLWLSNLMHHSKVDIDDMINALKQAKGPLVCVSNEVGMGLVPDTSLGREFRDLQGELNARVATAANAVTFVAAGLPLSLKAPQ